MAEISKIASRIQVDTAPAIKSLQAMQQDVESSKSEVGYLKAAGTLAFVLLQSFYLWADDP